MSEPKVSIITVNYNQAEETCALLESIRQQDYPAVEMLVIDNASRENPEQLILQRFPEVIFLRSEQNLGFAGGNNLALPYATGDYLFFVNNDAELTDGCIQQMLAVFREQPKAGMVSPLICYMHVNGQPDVIQYAGMTQVNPLTGRNYTVGNKETHSGQFTESTQTAYAHGAAMMIPRRVLEEVGPMDEGFFLYYEELDWCERIRRAGWQVWVQPLAKVYHKESLTVGKMGPLKTYYLTRNRIRFMQRNFSRRQLLSFHLFLLLVTIPKNTALYVWRGEWENLRAFLRGVFQNDATYRPNATYAPLVILTESVHSTSENSF